MKSIALGIALPAGVASVSYAADMPVKSMGAPSVTAAPACQWCGWYIGVNGGGAWSNSRPVFVNETFAGAPFFSGTFGDLRPTGGFGGGTIGISGQNGAWVYGLEADFEGASINGSAAATIIPYLAPGNSISVANSQRLDWFGTVRGRLGWAVGPALLYGTGGFAYGNVRSSVTMSDTFGFIANTEVKRLRGGYALGGGVEYRFAPRWSTKLEYQYINLGDDTITATETAGGAPSAFAISETVKFEFHTLRLGVNYQF